MANFRILALIAIALCLMASARADNVPAPALVVQGIATTVSGKPLAGVTLYMIGLPPGDYGMTHLGAGTTVVTNAQGRFTWTLSTDAAINANPDSSAPACYALPTSAGWHISVDVTPAWTGLNADNAQRDLMERATRRCETRWVHGGANPLLSVIAPDMGIVTLKMRSPAGQPLAGQKVQIVSAGLWSNHEGAVVYSGQTDAAGRLRMRWFPGLLWLLISVPGVGFGSTGIFEALPDKEATPQVPPLAPFARVSGTVAPALVKPGAFVHMDDFWFAEHKWYDPHTALDAQGRFTLADVLPGEHRLVLIGGQKEAEAASLTVRPGEQVSGIVLDVKPADAAAARVTLNPGAPPDGSKPSVSGHVTDATGKPVSGADVYALCSYDGGIRQYQEVLTTKTDADGAYRIPGLPGRRGAPSVSLVAVQAGHPVAQASAQAEAKSGNFQADLALPRGHPGLTVQALLAGKPLVGASVRLTPQGGTGLFDRAYVGSARGPTREVVASLLQPTATTDAKGEAQFTDLAPGLWDVTAMEGKPESMDQIGRWWSGLPQTTAFNISQGVIVGPGPPRRFVVSLYPQPSERAFQVLDPNGRPPAEPNIAFEFGIAGESGGSSTSITLDKDGNGKYRFGQSGLWRFGTRFRDTPLDSYPAAAEPVYDGSALLAVSPALSQAGPVVIHTIRRGPGRIRAHLSDSAGHPLAGSVFIGDPFDNAKYGASFDAQGEAVFADMPSGQYLLTPALAGQPGPPALGHEGQPFPTDAALSGLSLPTPETVTVRSDQEATVTFHPKLLGYVRGKVSVPNLASRNDYNFYGPWDAVTHPTLRYDTKTGDFLMGPLPPGKAFFHLYRVAHGPGSSSSNEDVPLPVNVPAGGVVHATLTPAPTPPAAPVGPTEAMLTMGGVFSSNRNSPLLGRVFLPDGVTPAWGARAALVVPQTWQPVQMARADALGRLNVADYWYTSGQPADPPPGSPAEPVLVAWLPGANGAVVISQTPGMEEHLVLPEPLSAQGRVMVSGKSVAGLPSSFRILAAYQGRGKLNPLLSVEATAQADGAFELGGLTPGTYQVQAARDGIWLSAAQTLVVGSGPLPALTLDIAPPGAPMILHFVDSGAQPMRDHAVSVERPLGPLTDALWPKTLVTDGSGDLRLEGLEAGPHQISFDDPKAKPNSLNVIRFDVPLTQGNAVPVEKKIIIP